MHSAQRQRNQNMLSNLQAFIQTWSQPPPPKPKTHWFANPQMFKTEKFVAKARQTKVKVDFRKDTSKYDGGEMKRRSPYKPQ